MSWPRALCGHKHIGRENIGLRVWALCADGAVKAGLHIPE